METTLALSFAVLLCCVCTSCKAGELKVDVLYAPNPCEQRSQDGDHLEYHYVGRFLDGSEFDCSFNYNQPYKFTLGRRQVIEGMDKGLAGVCVGERLKITIPPEMAYGEGGVGDKIPPNSTLVFYVDMLTIRRNNVTLSTTVTSDQLLYSGTNAYVDERWQDCVDILESAITIYKEEQDKLMTCLAECKKSSNTGILQEESVGSTDYALFNQVYYMFKQQKCAKQCKAQLYGKHKSYSPDTAKLFEDRTVFNYLQMCYYHLGSVDDARVAAETFYDFNVGSELGLSNLRYYGSLKSDSPPDYSPREVSMEHQKLYAKGRNAYGDRQFSTVVEAMEAALEKFYVAVGNCQLRCIDNFSEHFDEDMHNELGDDALMVAARYLSAYLLCCKDCVDTLTYFEVKPGNVEQNYLGSHYHYLQFAYYQVQDMKSAAQCAGTYIVMHPDDDVMKGNIAFYKTQANITDNDFNPRQDAYKYHVEQTKLEMLRSTLSVPRSAMASKIRGPRGDTGDMKEDKKKQRKQNTDTNTSDLQEDKDVGSVQEVAAENFEDGSPIIRDVRDS